MCGGMWGGVWGVVHAVDECPEQGDDREAEDDEDESDGKPDEGEHAGAFASLDASAEAMGIDVDAVRIECINHINRASHIRRVGNVSLYEHVIEFVRGDFRERVIPFVGSKIGRAQQRVVVGEISVMRVGGVVVIGGFRG